MDYVGHTDQDMNLSSPGSNPPTCLKIVGFDDYTTQRHTYDAEIFDDFNDDVIAHLTHVKNDALIQHDQPPTLTQINAVMSDTHSTSKTPTSYSSTFSDIHNSFQQTHVTKLRFLIEEPQLDSGANKSVTNVKTLLRDYQDITPIPVYGVEKDEVACHLIGRGFFDLPTSDGTILSICIYYSPECSGTIISPNAVVWDHPEFTSWTQTSHLDTGVATVTFFNRRNRNISVSVLLHMQNSLWYTSAFDTSIKSTNTTPNIGYVPSTSSNACAIVNSLRKHTEYELWHQRLLHAGHTSMDTLYKCAHGVPQFKRHDFHSCKICHEMNITKSSNKNANNAPVITAFGQRFQMDFGFMKGKLGNNTNIRSHDGYNSYLLIVDYHTRYLWVFLTKNKSPPLKVVTQFLSTYGTKDGTRIIRTDQGGELARSQAFRAVLDTAGYSLEITGSDNSSQNSIAERPHRTLGDMVRAGLENSGLHPKYWSDAFLHAAHVKNRLPHSAFDHKATPYERLTGMKPDLSNLRIFGCPITTRRPGKRTPKISKHSYNGLFLRYAKTMRNIVYFDTNTRKIKTTTYAKFDEAHYSHKNKPPGAQILMELGMRPDSPTLSPTNSKPIVQMVKRHAHAITPTRGSTHSAGYDLYATETAVVPPQGLTLIDTGISAKFPPSTYGRIASRSGLALKHNIETKGGVIDPDYTGTIKVILYNFGDSPFEIKHGDRIAQLIVESYTHANIQEINELPQTKRAENGFGSTDNKHSEHTPPKDIGSPQEQPHIIPPDDPKITKLCTPTNKRYDPIELCTTINNMETDFSDNINACDIEMDWHRPIFTTTISIPNTGQHITRGFQLVQDEYGPIVKQCIRGTVAAKIPKWRQTIKGSTIHSINGTLIKDTDDVISFIKSTTADVLHIKFIQPQPTAIHEDTGLPQLNFDQFVTIASHHQDIIRDNIQFVVDNEMDIHENVQISKLVKKTLTRTKLKTRSDWPQWEQS